MGRSNVSGPHRGSYLAIPVALIGSSETPGAVTTSWFVPIPCGFRISEISVGCKSSAGGASRPTIQVTDGTNDLLSSVATIVSAGSVVLTPTSTPSLVAAQRSRAKGDVLEVDLATVASEAVAGLVLMLTGYTTSHVVALATND